VHAPVRTLIDEQNEPPPDYAPYGQHALVVDGAFARAAFVDIRLADTLEEQVVEETIETSSHPSSVDEYYVDPLPANILDD